MPAAARFSSRAISRSMEFLVPAKIVWGGFDEEGASALVDCLVKQKAVALRAHRRCLRTYQREAGNAGGALRGTYNPMGNQSAKNEIGTSVAAKILGRSR